MATMTIKRKLRENTQRREVRLAIPYTAVELLEWSNGKTVKMTVDVTKKRIIIEEDK